MITDKKYTAITAKLCKTLEIELRRACKELEEVCIWDTCIQIAEEALDSFLEDNPSLDKTDKVKL